MPQEPDTKTDPTIHPKVIRKIRRILLKWGRNNYKHYPWREPPEAWYGLIAEVLLQRTRANSVVPVYNKFVDTFSTPDSLGKATKRKIEKIIYPLGLKWRAPFIKQLGLQLGEMGTPTSLDGLLKLPGVGPYAAAAWLGFHGGKRSVIVDANIVGFICRLTNMLKDGETRRKKWVINIANTLTPERTWKAYNYAILDFTMEICMKRPKCAECPVGPDLCVYGKQNLQKI